MLIRLGMAALLALLFVSSDSLGQWATDSEMVQDALAPIIGPRLAPPEKSARIQQLNYLVNDRANSGSNELSSATIVFKRGMSAKRLANLADAFGLEVAGMNVKAPLNDRGVVQSLLIGSDDLLRSKGSLEVRIEHAIGYYRYQFLETAEALPEGEAQDIVKMAKSPMRIYGCDVIGKAQSLSELTSHPDIQLVAIDPRERSEGNVSSYLQLKAEYEDAWRQLEAVQ